MTIPTFASFQTASRALTASQALITITGNNISNVSTEGYSRQRVDLTSVSLTATTKFASTSNVSSSLGVAATGVSQIRDVFLDARYRAESADNGRYSTLSSSLSDLQNIFDEIDTDGVQSQLLDFAEQLETFSSSPTDSDIALTVKTSAEALTAMLNSYSQQITEVRDQAIYDLDKAEIADFNSILESVAALNSQIKEQEITGNTPNELYDKRNLLLDELSSMANIKVTTSTEQISDNISVSVVSVSLYDEDTGTKIPLVSDGEYSQISLNTDEEQVSIELTSNIRGVESGDITDYFTTGSISGYLDVINGAGSYAEDGENTFRGTLYYLDALNTFASTFAETFNTLNDVDGTDDADLFSTSDGSDTITALNICISSDWDDDSLFLNAATTDAGDDEADNILKMIEALEGDISFTSSDGTLKFTGTFYEYMTGVTSVLAGDITLNDNYLDTSDTVLASLADSRDSISGVSLDEEGVNLLAYQKSYNAAARFLTALDEMLETLISETGVVGR